MAKNMGLVHDHKSPNEDPLYAQLARRLTRILEKRNKHITFAYAKVIKACRKVVMSHPGKEAIKVLRYIKRHSKDEYIPQINKPEHFPEKYDAILTYMAKDTSTIKISDVAKDIANRLRRGAWPKGSDQQLDVFVQVSLNNYATFYTKFCAFPNIKPNLKSKDGSEEIYYKNMLSYHKYMKDILFCSPRSFIEDLWLPMIADIVSSWPNWDGDIMKFVFKETSKRFLRWCWDYAYKWCNNSTKWDKLMEMINANGNRK